MKKHLMLIAALITVVATPLMSAEKVVPPLTGTVTLIDGTEVNLADYKGKVILVVNVASKCGFTRQYKQLQEVYEKYKDRGFTVLGFPCNQFGKQEPGTDADIKSFCETKFSVTFPMFSKVEVNGENALPLFKYLTSDKVPIKDQGKINWNFEKFLLNRDGAVIARYRSRVSPDAAPVIAEIETALGPATGKTE